MKKLVIKIGTSTLTRGTDKISIGKIEEIARQVLELKRNYEVILVTSGAIATARQFINLNGGSITKKQALAAVGQPILMRRYSEVFKDFGIWTAQCLLTYRDFQDGSSKANTNNTINELLINGFVPIINENDTVATEEIEFGDNDILSALVAKLVKAKLLIIVSDVNGLYDKNPSLARDAKLIKQVNDLSMYFSIAGDSVSGLGRGGMRSKLEAAKICMESGIEMRIVNGGHNNFLIDGVNSKIIMTRFFNSHTWKKI